MPEPVRRLVQGDNLEGLATLEPESVDLVILDPPFEITGVSGKNAFAPPSFAGSGAGDFTELWGRRNNLGAADSKRLSSWDEKAYSKKIRLLMRSYETVHSPAMRKFHEYLAVRMEGILRAMRPGASLVAQTRPEATGYTRLLLDLLFGVKNFQGTALWLPDANSHQNILRYSKEERSGTASLATSTIWRETEEGNPEGPDSESEPEYPTDSPVELYRRILESSLLSPSETFTILDPFLGGGNSLVAAELGSHSWIGMDFWPGAKRSLKRRLRKLPGRRKLEFEVLEV